MYSELEDTVSICMRHKADKRLAEIIFHAFHPLRTVPVTDLNGQARKAAEESDFYRLGFACLLKGETQMARRYLQGAFFGNIFYEGESLAILILDSMDKIQEVITASVGDFNGLRATKYEMPTFQVP